MRPKKLEGLLLQRGGFGDHDKRGKTCGFGLNPVGHNGCEILHDRSKAMDWQLLGVALGGALTLCTNWSLSLEPQIHPGNWSPEIKTPLELVELELLDKKLRHSRWTLSCQTPEGVEVAFDDEDLVANAGLLLISTLSSKLDLADVIADKVDHTGRVGGANPASKSLTLIHALVAGASHIDHVDMLRSGASSKVLPFRVVAPSTLITYLRSFTFGHVRQ